MATSSPSTVTKIGIAIYAQTDERRNRPRAPHWALVLHYTSFSAPDVRAFHIRGGNGMWTIGREHEGCEIRKLGALVGVLQVGEVSDMPVVNATTQEKHPRDGEESLKNVKTGLSFMKASTFPFLCAYLAQLPSMRNGLPDPGELFIWTCESYVIRALAFLEAEGALKLPCAAEEVYEYTKRRISVLKAEKEKRDREGSLTADGGVVVVPLAEL